VEWFKLEELERDVEKEWLAEELLTCKDDKDEDEDEEEIEEEGSKTV